MNFNRVDFTISLRLAILPASSEFQAFDIYLPSGLGIIYAMCRG